MERSFKGTLQHLRQETSFHSETGQILEMMIKPKAFKDWNEEMVKKYDPDAFHHHSNPIIRFIERERVRAILGLLKGTREGRVLEVGC
jgi:hypothetical protein